MPILEYQRPKSGSVIERRLESGVIESYQSIRDLGQGGSGSVRLFASKTGLERYAVKRPLEVQRHSLDYLKLEERLFKKVYPNAEVLFSATSNIDGRLVMPFFPGYSFNAALIKYSDRIDEIVLAVALELQRIHQNGVIHGDIRSDNIIIEEKNGIFNAKFIDFGWAYEYPSDDNVIVIKCSYFAPERAKVGIKAHPSQDVYSFGWMLGIAHDLVKEIPEKFYGFLIGANEEDPVLRPELRLLIKANLCPTLGEHYTELAIDNLDSYQLMRNMGLNKAYTEKALDNLPLFIKLGLSQNRIEKALNNLPLFIKMQDLGLNQNYIEKALDNPAKGNLIKVFLEAGLDRAISNAQQRGNQKKLAMAKFFKSKVETEESQIVLKNAAHVLHHRLGVLAAKSYKAAESCFEESRKLLDINDRDWKSILSKGYRATTSGPVGGYQTFKYYKRYMDTHNDSLEQALLTS